MTTLDLTNYRKSLAAVRDQLRKAKQPGVESSDEALAAALLSYGIACELADLRTLREQFEEATA